MNIINRMIEVYGTESKSYKLTREDILELSSMRDALRFYGNEDNYESPIYNEHDQYNGSHVDKDGGAIARVVLWEIEKDE